MRTSAFKNILVGVDFSTHGSDALTTALLLAAEREETLLHAVHVAGPTGDRVELSMTDGVHVLTLDEAAAALQEHIEAARVDAMRHGEPIESERVSVHVRVGDPERQLVELAQTLAADLLIVGTHGRSGLKRLVLGSVAEGIVRSAPCAVMVVRPKHYGSEKQ